MKNTTLCYIQQDGCYLMLHRTKKKGDENAGKWIGVGGKFEEGESPEECLVREVREETGLLADPETFTLLLQEDCRGDTHFDIYALSWDGDAEDIRFQPGETDAARWVPLEAWQQVAGADGTLCPAQRQAYRQELYRRIALYQQGKRTFS